MQLEKEFWRAAGYRSIGGEPVWLTAQEHVKAGLMVPSSEEERRAALNEARKERTDAISEHEVWLDGKRMGDGDRAIKSRILEYKKNGQLIPSTVYEIAEAKKEGTEYFLVDSQIVESKQYPNQHLNLEVLEPRVDYLPPDGLMVEGGLPPQEGTYTGSRDSFAARESTGAAMTAAEMWYRGTLNSIPKKEIAERIKSGINTGFMVDSSPEEIIRAVNVATQQVKEDPLVYGKVDIYAKAQPDLAIKKAIVEPMQQTAPYTATSRSGVQSIQEQARSPVRITTSPVLEPEPFLTTESVLTQRGGKPVVKPGQGAKGVQTMRMKAREAEDPAVVNSRIQQYEDYGVAQEYQTWVRSITPKMEPPPPDRHARTLPGKRRGSALFAISRLGVKGHGTPIQTMSGTDDTKKEEWSTVKKAGVGLLVLGALGGAAYGIKKVMGR